MRQAYPHFRSTAKSGLLAAEGDIQPTAMSGFYHVKIEYRADEPPKVRVLSPELKLRDDADRLPHTYRGDVLCLYLPGVGEWTPDMSLARTIVPWTAEWLFYYEAWLVTGRWLGGGVEPAPNTPIRHDNKRNATHDN